MLLSHPSYKQPSVWNLREQVAVAALDEGDLTTAESHIKLLTKEFPESSRVGRLKGMLLEAKGDYTNALSLYNEILKKDVANVSLMKRKVLSRVAPPKYLHSFSQAMTPSQSIVLYRCVLRKSNEIFLVSSKVSTTL